MIAIIDYGAGNLHSVKNALDFLNAESIVTGDSETILNADKVILPGVGAFGDAMKCLEKSGLVETVKAVAKSGKPLLGICLGLHLMFEESNETLGVNGLGIFKGKIVKIPEKDGLKIPHMGWNSITVTKNSKILKNIGSAMTVSGKLYTDKKEAGVALISAASGLKSVKSAGQIGEYHGFALSSEYNFLSNTYTLTIKGKCSYKIEFGKDTLGNIQRIHNALSAIEKKLADTEQNLETVQQQLKTAQEEVQKPFTKEAELSEKMERLAELNAMLNMDEKGGENLLADEGIGENPEVNVTEERQDRIADSVHKTSILERLKEQKQQEQTGEIQQKPKKKHEQEL